MGTIIAFFLLGLIFGGLIGVTIMCMLFISRDRNGYNE